LAARFGGFHPAPVLDKFTGVNDSLVTREEAGSSVCRHLES